MQDTWGLNNPSISSGAVYADLDNDGDLDLVVNNINEPAFVYQNMGREQLKSSYLQIKLKQPEGNINAVGAKVYLFSKGKQQYQEVNPNRGYLSCLPVKLHFGLGNDTQVDSVKIIWPDQKEQYLTNVEANQLLVS